MLLPLLLALSSATVASSSGLAWIDNDFSGAVARAKAEHKLVFVDAWATWCHSCLSMQRFVFVDPEMASVKDAVVWAAIETETEKNRDFTDKYVIEALPTFLLVDPDTGNVQGRWVGSGSVRELRAFVHDGAEAFAGATSAQGAAAARAESQAGHAAQQKGDRAAAVQHYRKALAATLAGEAQRPERVGLLALALSRLDTVETALECVGLGRRELSAMPASAVGADFSLTLIGCAEQVGKDDPGALSVKALATARLEALAGDLAAALSVDDRSDILANLADLAKQAKAPQKATAILRQRAKLLEDAAKAAPDFVLAATFDAHRTDTYLALKEPQRALALLTLREAQMPADYNPPARLARVLLELNKPGDAEAAVERALAKMTQGPRRVGVLALKSKILKAQGKPVGGVVREQLAVLKSLPSAQRRPAQEVELEAELARLAKGK